MSRLEPLDWLRGLLAVSIMVYHLTGWELYHPDASEFLGRLGIYGVSMFFVLSGLSMAVVYNGFIKNGRTAFFFLLRRVFRIWPLLWIAVAAVTVGQVILKRQSVDYTLVLLNITTLFGFLAPASYVNTGAWSIGNEMVYYALTPLILSIYDSSKVGGNLVLFTSIFIAIYFGFQALSTELTLADQWATYVNPFNNLFLYVAGIALFYNGNNTKSSRPVTVAMLFGAVAIFLWYPSSGDLIEIVTDTERVVFSCASVLLVFAFYKSPDVLPIWVSRPLVSLGVVTYGVYLLHPVVYSAISLFLRKLDLSGNPLLNMGLCFGLTVLFANIIYKKIEAPFIQLGKRLTRLEQPISLKL